MSVIVPINPEISVHVHLPPDASPELIDQILASMHTHLLTTGTPARPNGSRAKPAKVPKRDTPDLGPTQTTILHLLAEDTHSVEDLADAGYGLTISSARRALSRMVDRELVDTIRLDGNKKIFGLSDEGRKLQQSLPPLKEPA